MKSLYCSLINKIENYYLLINILVANSNACFGKELEGIADIGLGNLSDNLERSGING